MPTGKYSLYHSFKKLFFTEHCNYHRHKPQSDTAEKKDALGVPLDTSTPQPLYLWHKEHYKKGERKIRKARIPGS